MTIDIHEVKDAKGEGQSFWMVVANTPSGLAHDGPFWSQEDAIKFAQNFYNAKLESEAAA